MAFPSAAAAAISPSNPHLLFLFFVVLITHSPPPVILLVHSASSVPSTVPAGTVLDPTSNIKLLVSDNGFFVLLLRQWQKSGSSYCMCGPTFAKISNPSAISSFTSDGTGSPVQGSGCTLRLSTDGDLSLQHDGGQFVAWSSNTSGLGVVNMTLRDDGNLVLVDSQQNVVWQSFDLFRSIFFLPAGMNFSGNDTLYESEIQGGAPEFGLPGDYAMAFSPRGHLLLLLVANMFAYHSFASPGSSANDAISAAGVKVGDAVEFYNDTGGGGANIITTQLPFAVATPPNSSFPIRFGYLQEGNFLVNYWNGSENPQLYNTSVEACYKPYACGVGSAFKLCSQNPDGEISCGCPQGFRQDATNNYSCTASQAGYGMKPINVIFHPQYHYVSVGSQEECAKLCSDNSTCRAALFDSATRSCSSFPILFTLPSGVNDSQVLLLKVDDASKAAALPASAIAGIAAGAAAFFVAAGLLLAFVVKRRRRLALERRDEMFLADLPRLPPRFTHKELKAATANFSKLLGRGGFGTVYEGELGPTRVKVAVKRLDGGGMGGGGGGGGRSTEEFRAEVATIGSVSHVNLVRLRGFCMEGSVRMLVYEFMENGSLDRWLFKKPAPRPDGDGTKMLPSPDGTGTDFVLDWETRCRIALHTARGLEYLHHDSAEHIVHCDVKPENILLGHGFHAKVADFGLARLLGAEDQSFAMTTLKGTRGYLAPEWLQDTSVTSRSDVYSYGVVLLELITGRRCLSSESGYLPTWAMSVASSGDRSEVGGLKLQEVVLDERLEGRTVPEEELERLFGLAVACVQTDPARRPSMARVVQVIEEAVVGMEREAAAPPTAAAAGGGGSDKAEAKVVETRALLVWGEEAAAEVMSEGWGQYPSGGLLLPPR